MNRTHYDATLSKPHMDLLREICPDPEKVRQVLGLTQIKIEEIRRAFKGLPTFRAIVQTIELKLNVWIEQHPQHPATKRFRDLVPLPPKEFLPRTWDDL